MFCKVCFDASKSGYNTHNVRDYASNVVCPLLLNTKCNSCGYFGHTTKYCKFGGGSSKKATVTFAKSVAKVVNVDLKSKNMFAGMICSDAEEEPETTYDESVMDFENDPIIWGIGLTSMVGRRWADVVGC
jgi:Nanos RNA binding domain